MNTGVIYEDTMSNTGTHIVVRGQSTAHHI
jgi:hypothetical protein